MRLDAEAKKYGDVLHLPNVSNLTANDKTQGSEVTLNQVTETDNTVTINVWKECSFEIEDIVKTQSKYDLRSLYTQKAKPTKTGLLKPSLITGTAEMLTRGKQSVLFNTFVQPQRLSEMASKEDATVRTYVN